MNPQLNYMIAKLRIAELRTGEQARIATEVTARRRRLRAPNRINHASARSWPLRTMPVAERTIGAGR
jgi:hypothetical protein